MDNLDDLKILINELEVNLLKFYKKGNVAASIRARKILQGIKEQAQVIRVDISKTRDIKRKK